VGLVQLITTVGSQEDGLALGRAAVEEHAAACVQVLGPLTSVYRWEGRVREDQEYLCLMTAPTERVDRLVQLVKARHPYDTPELTVVASEFVDQRYLAWAEAETVGPDPNDR
jgi:periplasmic divalent cation tolerance protein